MVTVKESLPLKLGFGVSPGACFRIDGGRTVAGVVAGCDGEVGNRRTHQRNQKLRVCLLWMSWVRAGARGIASDGG